MNSYDRELGEVAARLDGLHDGQVRMETQLTNIRTDLAQHARSVGERMGDIEQQQATFRGGLKLAGVFWIFIQGAILVGFKVWMTK